MNGAALEAVSCFVLCRPAAFRMEASSNVGILVCAVQAMCVAVPAILLLSHRVPLSLCFQRCFEIALCYHQTPLLDCPVHE